MTDLRTFVEKVLEYEDPDKLDAALSVLPLEQLYAEAEKVGEDEQDVSEEDRLIKATLRWFKSWFQWVNAPSCDSCGFQNTEGPTPGSATAEEEKYGAEVTEIWNCPRCSQNTRFPRYNDPVKLLETRRGRCGEWCAAMQLILRALGRDTRFVWNSEDHVWNEIWSSHADRWIHVDSCEAAFDKPLIYSDGWGKKMAYVVGFSVGGARDITRRYVRRPDAALPRMLMPEDLFQALISSYTSELRHNFDDVDLVEWYERDVTETLELAAYASEATRSQSELPRQSGSKEWTESRGESGPAERE